MQTITAKFGGTSLADANMFRQVYKIVKSNPSRRFIVPSAPGKRFSGDEKITDLLYRSYDLFLEGQDPEPVFSKVRNRFEEIIDGLGLNLNLKSEFDAIEKYYSLRIGRDFFASRGEYLSGIVLANLLGFEFVDPADYIFFKENGEFDFEKTNITLSAKLKDLKNAVVPGFYGATWDGAIKTFSRGGSDITGALVARATESSLYENWTDVNGFLAANPKIVNNPVSVPFLSYTQLREMSFMGAGVLHEDAIYPARLAGIPINIKNTSFPEEKGTIISLNPPTCDASPFAVTGKTGYSYLRIKKYNLNHTKGFLYRITDIFDRNGVFIELCPVGVDELTVFVEDKHFIPKKDKILCDISDILSPDSIVCESGLSIIAVIVDNTNDSILKISSALKKANIQIVSISKCSGSSLVTLFVKSEDFEKATGTIYSEMI